MCGRLNLRDFETAVGGGWAAFTRRGSGDSHEARSSTGIRCMFGTSVRTYQGVIFAKTSVFVACCYHFVRMPISWCNRHAPMARHDSDNPAPAPPPRAPGRGGRPLSRDASPRPPKRMARQTPPAPSSPFLPAAAVTHGSGHDPTHWALHLPSFQAEVLRSRTPRLSDAALPPTHPPPPQDHRHMLTTCWQHRPALKCEGARRL